MGWNRLPDDLLLRNVFDVHVSVNKSIPFSSRSIIVRSP
jgi:hypothetical protein